tara:strand:- start:157 stop:291 length:135 start_codon:yes stop_codon:yes gene_type:complete
VIKKEDLDQGHKGVVLDLEIMVVKIQIATSNPMEMETSVETMDQ